jgi:hypothetical protein
VPFEPSPTSAVCPWQRGSAEWVEPHAGDRNIEHDRLLLIPCPPGISRVTTRTYVTYCRKV